MRLWLGPWQWGKAHGLVGWRPPAGSVVAIDFRSLRACGTPGPSAAGVGAFLTAEATALDSAYREVPASLGPAARNVIQTLLELPAPVVAATRRELVAELFTRHASPDGSTFARPLMPNRRRCLELSIAGLEFNQEIDPSSPFWAKVRAVYQEDYRAARQRALEGKARPDFHRKWLGKLLKTFPSVDYREFVPADLPKNERPLEPATTLNETFNQADDTIVGPTYSWTEYRADDGGDTVWETVSNQLYLNAAVDFYTIRAEADVSGADHECQITITGIGGGGDNAQGGVALRFAHANPVTGFNAYIVRALQILDQLFVEKMIDGTLTTLGSGQSIDLSGLPKVVKGSMVGSTLKGFFDGVELYSLTDTSITGNTRGGAFGYAAAPVTMDDWQLTDAGGAVAYTKDLSATLTPTAAIQKASAKGSTASMSSSASCVRLTSHGCAAELAPAAAIVKAAAKACAGAVSPSGIAVRQAAKSLSASSTATASVAKTANKTLAATVSPAGEISTLKVGLLALAATLSPTALVTKAVALVRGGTLSATGTPTKSIARSAAATLTPAAAAQKQIARTSEATVTPTGSLVRTIGQSLVAVLTPSAAVQKAVSRRLTATLSIAAAVAFFVPGVAIQLLAFGQETLRSAHARLETWRASRATDEDLRPF